MNPIRTLALAATLVVSTSGADAALVDRGGGMIYDSTLNITWLADMNYAKTSGYSGPGGSADGRMTWSAAKTWADNLVYGGFSDWRLPTLNPSDTTCSLNFNPGGGWPLQYYGYNCTGGELSHLFVSDLGNKAGESVLNQAGDTAQQMANLAMFSNVQSYHYWSGVEYAPIAGGAWQFDTGNGSQYDDGGLSFRLYAVAVRPGDVAASVPEPQAAGLALTALVALALTRRRRPR